MITIPPTGPPSSMVHHHVTGDLLEVPRPPRWPQTVPTRRRRAEWKTSLPNSPPLSSGLAGKPGFGLGVWGWLVGFFVTVGTWNQYPEVKKWEYMSLINYIMTYNGLLKNPGIYNLIKIFVPMSSVSSNTWHFWRSLLIAKWHIFPKRPEIPRFQKQHVVSSPDSSHQQLLELQRRQTTKSLLSSETLTTSNWFSTTKTLSHISLI